MTWSSRLVWGLYFAKYVMCCRPANTPTSIHPSLQIGIPAFIADREDIFQLYFVTVTPIPQILTAPGKMQVCIASRHDKIT